MTDREKVIHAVETAFELWIDEYTGCSWFKEDEVRQAKEDALAMLKEQDVKTGYWIDSAGNDKCSICGEEYSDLYPDYGNTHFCPNCGAKMEGR